MAAVIGALRVNLGLNSAEFEKGMRSAQNGLQRFGGAIGKVAIAAAAAGAAAVAALGVAVKGTIDAADDMSKAAQRFGVPIEELSRLKYAADLSGVAFNSLGTGLKRLSQNMNDAKNGVGEGLEAFEQLGITVTNADGSMKATSDVMAEMADRFAAMPDGAEKTALAMDLMGRAGADMIPLLNGGSDALRDLMAEADQFGQVFSEEMGENAEVFNDNMSRLQGTFGMIAAEITERLLPYLVQFSDWLVENAPAIANFVIEIVDFAAQIVRLGQNIVGFVTGAWAKFEAAWDGMTSKVGEVKAAIAQFAEDILDIFRALPAQMLQIGIDIIGGLWEGIQQKWGEVQQGIADIPNNIANTFTSILGIQSPSKVFHGIGGFIMQGLHDGMESMAGQTESLAGNIASTIGQSFQSVISGSQSVGQAIAGVLSKLGEMLVHQGFQALFGAGGGGGLGMLGSLFGGLFGFANGGSFQVGGSGGIDSQLVAFKASPNERVSVTKPGQDLMGGGGEIGVRVEVGVQNGELVPLITQVSGQVAGQQIKSNNRQLPSLLQDYRLRQE